MFLISDTHFFHNNIIKYSDRPFKNDKEMNNFMIESWNSNVGKNDKVIHLGDLAIGWDKTFKTKRDCYKDLVSKLNGYKILVRGNHDRETKSFYLDLGFSEVYDYYVYDNTLFIHYPLKIERNFMKPELISFIEFMKNYVKINKLRKIIHGHTHNRNPKLKNHYNVSVEMIGYKPIHYSEINNSLF